MAGILAFLSSTIDVEAKKERNTLVVVETKPSKHIVHQYSTNANVPLMISFTGSESAVAYLFLFADARKS